MPAQRRTWSPGPWRLTAVGAAAGLGVVAVWAVIRWHGGNRIPLICFWRRRSLPSCNTSLAAVAAALLIHQRSALVPLSVVAVIVVAAYRGYARLSKRYAGLDDALPVHASDQWRHATSGDDRAACWTRRGGCSEPNVAAVVLAARTTPITGLTLLRRGETSFERQR